MTAKTLKPRQVMMTGRLFGELSTLWGSSGGDPEATVFGITSSVKNSFRSVCKLAGGKYGGVEGVTLHSLRHTAANRRVNGRLPLQMVGRILGHSQVNTTYRYLSSTLETAARAAAILEKLHAGGEPDVEEVSYYGGIEWGGVYK